MDNNYEVIRDNELKGPFNYEYKIVLAGDKGVGKTSLLKRMQDNTFDLCYIPTVTGSYINLYYKVKCGNKIKTVKINLWDTSGEERYKAITKIYFNGASGSLLLYDITSISSWDSLPMWKGLIENRTDNSSIIYLVGTKKDLNSKRTIELDNVYEFAENNGFPVKEVSSKTGDELDE